MKKLIMITGAVLIVYLVLVTVISPQAETPSAISAETEQSVAEKGYRMGVSDGRVAVFRDGNLYLKTDTTVSSLPKSDRTRLEQGIEIDSLKELKALLQDYCS